MRRSASASPTEAEDCRARAGSIPKSFEKQFLFWNRFLIVCVCGLNVFHSKGYAKPGIQSQFGSIWLSSGVVSHPDVLDTFRAGDEYRADF